jgi:hypothetical protein
MPKQPRSGHYLRFVKAITGFREMDRRLARSKNSKSNVGSLTLFRQRTDALVLVFPWQKQLFAAALDTVEETSRARTMKRSGAGPIQKNGETSDKCQHWLSSLVQHFDMVGIHH